MIGIFQAKINMFIRSPWVFIMMTALSIGFALIIGGTGAYTAITIPVYTTSDSIQNSVIGDILEDTDVIYIRMVIGRRSTGINCQIIKQKWA